LPIKASGYEMLRRCPIQARDRRGGFARRCERQGATHLPNVRADTGHHFRGWWWRRIAFGSSDWADPCRYPGLGTSSTQRSYATRRDRFTYRRRAWHWPPSCRPPDNRQGGGHNPSCLDENNSAPDRAGPPRRGEDRSIGAASTGGYSGYHLGKIKWL